MKKILVTLLLTLAAGQAQAHGFYQTVFGDNIRTRTEAGIPSGPVSHTPLDQLRCSTRSEPGRCHASYNVRVKAR